MFRFKTVLNKNMFKLTNCLNSKKSLNLKISKKFKSKKKFIVEKNQIQKSLERTDRQNQKLEGKKPRRIIFFERKLKKKRIKAPTLANGLAQTYPTLKER
jgi:G:T-mismatch repair DNA endonuclease (very short patch repair protein)